MAIWTIDDPTGTLASEDPGLLYDVEPREYDDDLDAATVADREHDEQTNSDADPWEDIF